MQSQYGTFCNNVTFNTVITIKILGIYDITYAEICNNVVITITICYLFFAAYRTYIAPISLQVHLYPKVLKVECSGRQRYSCFVKSPANKKISIALCMANYI